MQLRNYVYLSKRKLDVYFPQVPKAFWEGATTKVGFDVKLAKAEISATETPPSIDHEKIERLISFLDEEGVVGTIERPRKFFSGNFSAKSITDGRVVFFGGMIPCPEEKKFLGLVCSIDNMIGLKRSDLPNYSQNSVGPTRTEYFVQNSNSLGFARLLRNLSSVHNLAATAEYDLDFINRLRRKEYELSEEERRVLKERAWLNGILNWSNPPSLKHIFREALLGGPTKRALSLFASSSSSRKQIISFQQDRLL